MGPAMKDRTRKGRRTAVRAAGGAGAIAVLIALAACGPRPVPAPPVAVLGAEVDGPTLLAAIRARADSLKTLSAGLELTWEDARFVEAESCRGSLSWVAPDRLRLRGHTASFFTVFDLVADGSRVWLDVPREKLLVHGRRDDPDWGRLPFSPDVLRIALLADPCPAGGCPEVIRVAEGGPPRIEAAGWVLEIDPATGLPVRYDSGETEIRWSGWAVRGGEVLPERIEILGRRVGGVLRIGLGRTRAGRSIPASRFAFEVESDREILTPEEAASYWSNRPFRSRE